MCFALAAVSLLLAMLVWLICGGRQLLRRQNDFTLADKQLALYRLLYVRARDGPQAQHALEQLELSQTICQNVATEYNRCIAKPIQRPVAWVLGFHSILMDKRTGITRLENEK